MGDIGDGLGGAIEGALTGNAVEREGGMPGAGVPSKRMVHDLSNGGSDVECRNCGAMPQGQFCQNCGQKVGLHRSIAAIGHDLMHGVLHLDGKLWRTLPLLALKPGKLTRRYIDGERAKFVSPMAMFLFSVFLMFAVFQAAGLTTPTNLNPASVTAEQLAQAKIQTSEDKDRLQAELAELSDGSERASAIRAELDDISRAEAFLQGAKTFAGGETQANAAGVGDLEESEDTSPGRITFEGEGFEWLETNLVGKWRDNPSLMLYKLQTNAYKFSWLLIPLSIPFVWIMFFWRRRFKAYDHAIFVTYSIAFMSLLFITVSALALIGAPTAVLVLMSLGIPPIHIYKQLRGTYELRRFPALVRTLALLSMIVFCVASLFLWIMIVLGTF